MDSADKGEQQSPTEPHASPVPSSNGPVRTTCQRNLKPRVHEDTQAKNTELCQLKDQPFRIPWKRISFFNECNQVAGKELQEDEKQKCEDDCKPRPEAVAQEPWALPYDAQFHNLIKETHKSVLPLDGEVEMYTALAKLVCEAMGGPVDIEKQHDFFWERHLSELKLEMQSNIIPIGKIKKGTYYHRALLFKVLADRIGLSCSLVRGHYSRAWNKVLLPSTSPRATGVHPQLQTYITDLMHTPGTFMKCGTPAAEEYQTI